MRSKEAAMSLAKDLDAIRERIEKRLPVAKSAIMHRATADLRASGILDHVVKVGDRLPPFVLRNADGRAVRSADLLAKGAVVLTVFRGGW
jgi:hypothetical protein